MDCVRKDCIVCTECMSCRRVPCDVTPQEPKVEAKVSVPEVWLLTWSDMLQICYIHLHHVTQMLPTSYPKIVERNNMCKLLAISSISCHLPLCLHVDVVNDFNDTSWLKICTQILSVITSLNDPNELEVFFNSNSMRRHLHNWKHWKRCWKRSLQQDLFKPLQHANNTCLIA